MFCQKCGKQMENDALFCEFCGAPAHGTEKARAQMQPKGVQAQQPRVQTPVQPQVKTPARPVQVANPGEKKKGAGAGKWALILIPVLFLSMAGGWFAMAMVQKNRAEKQAEEAVATESPAEAGSAEEAQAASDNAAEEATEAGPESAETASSEAAPAVEKEEVILSYVSSDVADYPTVKLFLRAEDKDQNAVTLESLDGSIREKVEGGEYIERKIRDLEKIEGNQGISIDLLADTSGSMEGDMALMQSILTEFVESLDYASGDRVELMSFDSYTMYLCTHTDDVDFLRNGIDNMTAYGGTALYNALVEGVQNAARQEGARCVIAFTDGDDNQSTYSHEEVITLANSFEVPVYLIGAGGVDSGILTRIAEETGGRFWNIHTLSDMNEVLEEIYQRQKDMVCVSYETDDSIDRYATRDISIELNDDAYAGKLETSFAAVEKEEIPDHEKGYELVKGDVSWTEANTMAISRGGHLATIESEEEMKQLSDMADAAGITFVWLGGYTSVRPDTVFGHWVTGEPFVYEAWFDGEPSRNDLDGAPEMYIMLWKIEGKWSWNDQRNDPIQDTGLKYFIGKTGYIIEWD